MARKCRVRLACLIKRLLCRLIHGLFNSKPYAWYSSSLRPSSFRSFRQIRFNSACVFADTPLLRPNIRPCFLFLSWHYSGLSRYLRCLMISPFYSRPTFTQIPSPENLSVSQWRLSRLKGKLNSPCFRLFIDPSRK